MTDPQVFYWLGAVPVAGLFLFKGAVWLSGLFNRELCDVPGGHVLAIFPMTVASIIIGFGLWFFG